MTSNSGYADDFLFHFNDNIIFSETELKEILHQTASLPAGAYAYLFHKLVSPPPNISRPVLELVLSCEMTFLSHIHGLLTFSPASECGDTLARWLMGDLSVLPDYFSPSSTAIEVLDKVSLSIPLLYAFEREVHMKLSNHRAEVQYSLTVIGAFLRFITSPGPSNLADEDLPFKTKQSQRSRKNARNRVSVVIDFDTKISKACEFLHITIPKTPDDARYSLHSIVQNLSKLLEVWIYLLICVMVSQALLLLVLPLCPPNTRAGLYITPKFHSGIP